jgi:hypothetical protein
MENWIQDAITNWSSNKVKMNPPAIFAEIEHVESVLDFKFPQDFKELYLVINGFEGLDWQEHMFTFWPLEMIIKEYKESNNKNFIGFSDFLLASHIIGFNKDKNGIFKQSYKEDGEFIANSFKQVVEMINSNDDLIY